MSQHQGTDAGHRQNYKELDSSANQSCLFPCHNVECTAWATAHTSVGNGTQADVEMNTVESETDY